MVELSSWSAVIPPFKLTDTGVIRILNHFNDEPPVFVGKPVNSRGFYVQQPGESIYCFLHSSLTILITASNNETECPRRT